MRIGWLLLIFMKNKKNKIAFFGTPEFAVKILDKMKEEGQTPSLIVTTPDKPKGRNRILTPPATKVWAEENNISILQPSNLKDEEFLNEIKKIDWDLFVVASYGKIIPQEILDIPKHRTINVHPSLLPKLRGATPIESAILKEEKTGTTIMLVDDKMDHGDILMQEKLETEKWPIKMMELENMLAGLGGEMLTKTIPLWVESKIQPKPQDHSKATFVDKFKKEDALINLKDNPEKNLRKIYAFQKYKPYFFSERNGKEIRVIIKDAKIENDKLIITRILPEGKKEMDYQDFLRG